MRHNVRYEELSGGVVRYAGAVVGATASTTLSYILPGTFYIQVRGRQTRAASHACDTRRTPRLWC
jgi:hypothetical protein